MNNIYNNNYKISDATYGNHNKRRSFLQMNFALVSFLNRILLLHQVHKEDISIHFYPTIVSEIFFYASSDKQVDDEDNNPLEFPILETYLLQV